MSEHSAFIKKPVHTYQCYYCGKLTRKEEQNKCSHCGGQILMKPKCNYTLQYVAR